MSDEAPKRRKEGARSGVRGLLGTLFTGTLVITAGFAIGVVAGLALEDPSLVKDYVSGETQELDLDGDPESLAVAPERDPALRAPPPGRAGFSIQVGAFADASSARQLADELEASGYPVYVAAPEGSDTNKRWRVRVGPLSTRDRAERVARELKSQRSLPTWVLDETAS